jgi:hypothetical protein
MPSLKYKTTQSISGEIHESLKQLVYCLRKDFIRNVIPDLIKPAPYLIRGNPVFSAGFPFPDQVEDKFHGNDNPYYHCKEVLETLH